MVWAPVTLMPWEYVGGSKTPGAQYRSMLAMRISLRGTGSWVTMTTPRGSVPSYASGPGRDKSTLKEFSRLASPNRHRRPHGRGAQGEDEADGADALSHPQGRGG